MNVARIKFAFSQAPASFVFRDGPNGRILGEREGAALQLDGPPDALTQTTLAVVLGNDAAMTRRSGVFLMLMLTACDPKWDIGHAWAMDALRMAAFNALPVQAVETTHGGHTYKLIMDKRRSLTTLVITREPVG